MKSSATSALMQNIYGHLIQLMEQKLFISGSPFVWYSDSAFKNGAPIMGIINIPATGERWIGGKDLPANLNGVEVRVRKGLAL